MADLEITSFDVGRLMDYVRDGILVLPEFQRDFVWSDDRISNLLVSVLKGWPAGTLLLSEMGAQSTYALRSFEGGPPVDPLIARYLVLDGQQRLTALYEALNPFAERVWALNLTNFGPELGPDELQDNIRVFTPRQWTQRLYEAHRGASALWIPFHALASESAFFKWRQDVATQAALYGEVDSDTALRTTLARHYKNGLDRLHRFLFPVVLIDKSLDSESVARIFERMNTSGLALSTFDLVVAHSYDEKWNLRAEWDEALDSNPILRDFLDGDGLAPIEIISLVGTHSVRRADVLRLPPEEIRANFSHAVKALLGAIDLCNKWGVVRPAFLPHRAFLIVMGAVLFRGRIPDRHISLLRSWFYSRAFVQRFNVAVNTTIASEYMDLVECLDKSASLRRLTTTSAQVLTGNARTSSALHRSFLALIAAGGVVEISSALFELPLEAYSLRAVPLLRPPLNRRVLGFVLLPAGRVKELEGRGAGQLLRLLEGQDEASAKFLSGQLLPRREGAYSDDESFLRARLDLLRSRMQEIVGYDVIEDT